MKSKSKNTKTTVPKKINGNGKSKQDAGQGLRKLFMDELKDIYWAEKELTKALPKMIKNATAEELAEALTEHLEVTNKQVTRLEEVFSLLGEKVVAVKCEAMTGLVKEAKEIMEASEKGAVRDAAIILSGQKIEHYEIATYGTLCAFAKILDENEVANLLGQTLDEEKEADEKLSEVAESSINIEANEEDDEEREGEGVNEYGFEDGDTMVAEKTRKKNK